MNPEIVTPQNIMRDTFRDVLAEFSNRGGASVVIENHITIHTDTPDEEFKTRFKDAILEVVTDARLGEIIAQGGTGW